MKKTSEIKKELNQLGITLPDDVNSVMQVPEGYFQTFSSQLLEKIKADEFLETLPKEMPYQVPANYFNEVSDQLNQEIQIEQFLRSLPKEMPYEVPANYFTLLASQLKHQINTPPTAIQPLIITRKWAVKLSMAASILLFISIAFKTLIMPSKVSLNVTSNTELQLSSVSDDEIQQYMLTHQTEVESNLALETIDENNIDLNKLENEIFDQSLNSISDEEILNYTL